MSTTPPRTSRVGDPASTSAADTLRAGLPDRYLTPHDIASLLSVPLETVYAWRKKRIGPPGFRVGKHLRYDPVAVHNWATQQQADDAAA